MTDEGKEQYRKARDLRWEKVDCEKCEKGRDYLLQYSTCFRDILKISFGEQRLTSVRGIKRSGYTVYEGKDQSIGWRYTQWQCQVQKMFDAAEWRL